MSKASTVPAVHLLQSLANQRMSWADSLGEFIDNSLDALATEVSISISDAPIKGARVRTLTVQDNGLGIEELPVLVRLGARKEHLSTKLGRYGIGSKDAAFSIGGTRHRLQVDSTFAGQLRTMDFRWSRVIDRGIWLDAEASAPVPSAGKGTQIRVTPIEKAIPSGEKLERTLARLGYIFSPAINTGAVIRVFMGKEVSVLRAYRLPRFDGAAIDQELTVDGKTIRVHCGLVADGETNHHPGLTYYHGHRTILGPTAEGCEGFSTARIAGVVELKSGWQLTKNKDNVNRASDKLFAAVFDAIRPILERAEKLAQSQQNDSFQLEVENMLNLAAFGDAAGEADSKAVRGEGDKRGRIEPKGSGRKHRDARVIQPGRTFASRNFTHLKVVYAALSEGTLGEFASNGIVQLSTNHPAVTKALGDRNVSTVAILACSVAAFSDASRARLSNILGIDPEQPDAPLQILSEFSRRIALSTGAAAPVAEAAE